MCVIIYKKAGDPMPALSLLKKAYKINHDGCGLCSPSVYFKGLSFESFCKALKKCNINEPLLIHFRWATQGSVKRSNCHPFLDIETGIYFMHNGIMSTQGLADFTDSEIIFRTVFMPGIRKYGFNNSVSLINTYAIGNRFAFMQGDKVRLFGTWCDYQGLKCSNLRFI